MVLSPGREASHLSSSDASFRDKVVLAFFPDLSEASIASEFSFMRSEALVCSMPAPEKNGVGIPVELVVSCSISLPECESMWQSSLDLLSLHASSYHGKCLSRSSVGDKDQMRESRKKGVTHCRAQRTFLAWLWLSAALGNVGSVYHCLLLGDYRIHLAWCRVTRLLIGPRPSPRLVE